MDKQIAATRKVPFFLQLHPKDNVVVLIQGVKKGTSLGVNGKEVIITQDTELGHKVAIQEIQPGDKIIKCGTSIGSATAMIHPGDHVHVHNVQSDYLPTYTLKDAFHG